MNVSGPTPISPRMDDPTAAFRLHQRFEAEVLQVAGERVALSVAGVSIVARMTSTEQAAILTQHRRATFQVQETGPEMKLKLVTASSTSGAAEGIRVDLDPAVELLRQAGISPDETNLQLARACLQNRVVITKSFITQMRGILEQALSPPGQEKSGAPGTAASGSASLAQAAQTAVSWAAAGRTLTPATLSLLLQELPDLTNLVASLRAGLASARSRLSPEDAALLDKAIQWLDDLAVELPSDGDLAEKLQKAIRLMGRSLEAELASENPNIEEEHSGLYSLAQLSRRLAHGEQAALKSEIEQLLGRLNQQSLRNTPAPQAGMQEQWLALEIPCSLAYTPGSANGALGQGELPVHLRILKKNQSDDQPDGRSGSRFIIQAEAAPGKVIEVDLSILERSIQVYVSAPDTDISGRAADEMDGLSQGLARLGYEVQNAVIGVKETPAQHPSTDAPKDTAYGRIRHADWRA